MIEIVKRLSVGELSKRQEPGMSENLDWEVLRPHEGDRWYNVGEIRKGSKHELQHLSPNTLKLVETLAPKAAKAERTSTKNKAEGVATTNKAEPGQQAS